MVTPNILAVIPARLHSSRLPQKLLQPVHKQKPLIVYSYENARTLKQAGLFSRLIVAVDDKRLAAPIEDCGGSVMYTSPQCANGTERSAEVLKRLSAAEPHTHYDYVLNLQADEPLVPSAAVKALIALMQSNVTAPANVAALTLMKAISPERAAHPNAVKIVTAADGRALYFSRSPIPALPASTTAAASHRYMQHIGIYAYKSAFLTQYPSLKPTPLEQAERLEQLRILEHGYSIIACEVNANAAPPLDINDAADLARLRALIAHTE